MESRDVQVSERLSKNYDRNFNYYGLFMMTTGMVSIKDLGNKYQLKDPIEVTIEEDRDGSLVAYWHSVDAVGYGGTLQETVDALKEDVSFLYENLEELPEKCQHLLDKLVIEK